MAVTPLATRVKAVLDRLDPEGLLEMGAPESEYLLEAEDFGRRLARGEVMTPEVVQEVWVGRFYPDCRLVKLGLADQLAQALNHLADSN